MNHYPVDNAIGFRITYPLDTLDSDLSGGYRYPTFQQPGLVLLVVLRLLRKRMDHNNKFKNTARVIKHFLQVLKLSKEFLPLSLPHYEGHTKRLKLVTKLFNTILHLLLRNR